MRTFRLSVFWTVGAYVEVEAETREEAMGKARDAEDLPDGDYLPGSFEVDYDYCEDITPSPIERLVKEAFDAGGH